jgi:prevent-host-death family protein
MKTVTVADAKARLSAVLDKVEAGEEIVITRRGRAVARIVPERTAPPGWLELEELFAFVDSQPMHPGPDAGAMLRAMRDKARY